MVKMLVSGSCGIVIGFALAIATVMPQTGVSHSAKSIGFDGTLTEAKRDAQSVSRTVEVLLSTSAVSSDGVPSKFMWQPYDEVERAVFPEAKEQTAYGYVDISDDVLDGRKVNVTCVRLLAVPSSDEKSLFVFGFDQSDHCISIWKIPKWPYVVSQKVLVER